MVTITGLDKAEVLYFIYEMCMNFVTVKHCLSGGVTPLPHTSYWCVLRQLHLYFCLYLWTGYSVLHRAGIRSLPLFSRHSYSLTVTWTDVTGLSSIQIHKMSVLWICQLVKPQDPFSGLLQEKQWNVGSCDKENFIASVTGFYSV